MLSILAWAPVLALVFVAATRFVGADEVIVVIAGHALLPWVLLAAWPMAVAAVLHRRWAIAICAACVAVAHVGWSAPLVDTADDATASPNLRILTMNLLATNRRISDVATEIMAVDADVLLLQELTPRNHAALAAAGALDGYRHAVAHPRLNSTGSAIYSRLVLEEGHVWSVGDTPMTRAVLVVAGRRVRLFNVHTTSPLTRAWSWNRELRALAAEVNVEDGPVLLAGDFNATRDHAGMRRLLRTNLVDAHDETGRAGAATWPAGRRLTPALIRLDHVLVGDGIVPVRVRELAAHGSDHRPVVADLAVT